MAAPNNPPQVHLQLGHQTFKRSFHQFGLDVDDADDSETNNVASYSGASSGSTVSSSDNESNSIASGSSSTGRGLRSVSSGSSYSSGGSSDYAGGQRNERNKRARSDGPDTVRILRSDESSSSADSSGSSMPSPSSVGLNSVQHALTPTEYDSEGASSSASSSSSVTPAISPQYDPTMPTSWPSTSFSFSSSDSLSSSPRDPSPLSISTSMPPFTLSPFRPLTPSIAEFSASRNAEATISSATNASHLNTTTTTVATTTSISTEHDRLPGFAAMLAPRLSSPAPPPTESIVDVVMDMDDSSLSNDRQTTSSQSSSFDVNSGTGPRDEPGLTTATASLRRAIDRAAAFDRTLAPLRLENNNTHTQDNNNGPRVLPSLPRFDFEGMTHQTSDNSTSENEPSMGLVLHLNSRSTRSSLESMSFVNPLTSEEEDTEADDIAVDRALSVEGTLMSHAAAVSSPDRTTTATRNRGRFTRNVRLESVGRLQLSPFPTSRTRPSQPNINWDGGPNNRMRPGQSTFIPESNTSGSIATNAMNALFEPLPLLNPLQTVIRDEDPDSESDSERIERMVRLDSALDLNTNPGGDGVRPLPLSAYTRRSARIRDASTFATNNSSRRVPPPVTTAGPLGGYATNDQPESVHSFYSLYNEEALARRAREAREARPLTELERRGLLFSASSASGPDGRQRRQEMRAEREALNNNRPNPVFTGPDGPSSWTTTTSSDQSPRTGDTHTRPNSSSVQYPNRNQPVWTSPTIIRETFSGQHPPPWLQELRERHRTPANPTPTAAWTSSGTQESQSQMNRDDGSSRPSDRPQGVGQRPSATDDTSRAFWDRIRLDSGQTAGRFMPSMNNLSSSEAAAFFASSPFPEQSNETVNRDPPSPLESHRRRRPRPVSDIDGAGWTRRDERTGNQFNFSLNSFVNWNNSENGGSNSSGVNDSSVFSRSSDLPEPPIQGRRWGDEDTDENTPNDLSQVLFPGQTHRNRESRPTDNSQTSVFSPASRDNRTLSWTRDVQENQRSGAYSNRFSRVSSNTQSSQPPSLPPIRFSPGLSGLGSRDERNSSLESSIERNNVFRLRRRLSNPGSSGGIDSWDDDGMHRFSRRVADANREGELAIHRARYMQALVQRSGILESRERPSDNHTRPPSEIFGEGPASSLSDHVETRYRFARRNHDATRSNRVDTHTHWGEMVDEPQSIRTGLGSTLRSHPGARLLTSLTNARNRYPRNVSSALFADPPANADNAPPNRGRPVGFNSENRERELDNDSSLNDWILNIQRRRAARMRNEELPSMPFNRFGRRAGMRSYGDFMRDEDLDTSYEGLLALGSILGDVKPRATASSVIELLPSAHYKDWKRPGCDTRCPICLDDYGDTDMLLKALPCNHWCHKDCLEQWFHAAQTCPICRSKVKAPHAKLSEGLSSAPSASSSHSTTGPVPGPSRSTRMGTPGAENEGSEMVESDSEMMFFSTSSSDSLDEALFSTFTSNHVREPPFPGFHIRFM